MDFSRFGGFAEAEYRITSSVAVNGIAGFYQDHYSLGRPRMNGNCNTNSVHTPTTDSPTPSEPALCRRDDSGTVFQGGLRWNIQDDTQLSTSLLYVDNGNSTMREYDFQQLKFLVTLTRAFPNVQRVERMSERFADYVFFKEAR